jgi:nitrogen-specific signal transduction histidine kinase
MNNTSMNDPGAALNSMKLDIRQVAHDISNPLGILRMAVYFLETAKPDDDKRAQYYSMMSQNIDRIEVLIKQLRVLGGSPSAENLPPDPLG